jgi:hypothetical protein
MIDISKIICLKMINNLHTPLNKKVDKKMDSYLMQNIMDRGYNNMGGEISIQFYTLIRENLKK